MTPNEEYFDAQIRHQIGIRRFASGQWNKALSILEKEDKKLVRILRKRLKAALRSGSINSPEFRSLIREVKKIRRTSIVDVKREVADEIVELAKLELSFEARLLGGVLPDGFTVNLAGVAAARRVAVQEAFQGRRLREWFDSLVATDQRRIVDAIQKGMTDGQGIDDIVTMIVGNKNQGFKDGALFKTRRDAEAIVRTSVNHASNAARELVWVANADIITMLMWNATLDGRTSPICRARDGKFAPVGQGSVPSGFDKLEPPGARPPAHVNCRSVMVAIMDPTVLKEDTRVSAFGQVPADTNYSSFLRRQSASFQDGVLGKTKGSLFRKGGADLDQFVDRAGNELTLQQLRATMPNAF